ncbi:MAG: STAS domain-containing protein [Acidobacteria bacterium]|nr:STAS domain-containing protein [Acidobacteriota bacterium]
MEPNFDAPDYSLQIEKEIRRGVLLIHCRGGFSLVNHALLDGIFEQIKVAPERKVVLDLAGIRFMDSVGVGTIAAILKHTMATDRDFVLVSNDTVDHILASASMTKVMRIVRNLDDAFKAFAP